MLFYIKYNNLPYQQLYWSTRDDIVVSPVRSAMTKDRFRLIKSTYTFAKTMSSAQRTALFKSRNFRQLDRDSFESKFRSNSQVLRWKLNTHINFKTN